MTLTLDPQLEQRIQRQIDSGRFRDADEVLNYGLDLLMAARARSEEERADLEPETPATTP